MTQKEKNRNLAQGLYTSPKVSNKLSFHYQISVEFELLGTKHGCIKHTFDNSRKSFCRETK